MCFLKLTNLSNDINIMTNVTDINVSIFINGHGDLHSNLVHVHRSNDDNENNLLYKTVNSSLIIHPTFASLQRPILIIRYVSEFGPLIPFEPFMDAPPVEGM